MANLNRNRKLNFAAITWNINAKLPMQLHLEQLFSTTLRGDKKSVMPDVLAISIQEMVELNLSNCVADGASRKNGEYWVRSLLKCLNRRDVGADCHYNLVMARHCVGTFLTVLVQCKHVNFIRGLCSGHLAIGRAGLGNKAGIAMGMNLYGVAIAIVGCHLPSGRSSKNLKERNHGFNFLLENMMLRPAHDFDKAKGEEERPKSQIIHYLDFQMDDISDDDDDDDEIPPPAVPSRGLVVNRGGTGPHYHHHHHHHHCISRLKDYDVVFWMGDMNYRIEEGVSNMEAYRLISQQVKELLQMDQLTQARCTGEIKQFTEGKITFNPTYKYIPGTDKFDRRPDKKMRCPAWTDRVLWRNVLPPDRVKQVHYNSCTIPLSDHMPVTAVFELQLLENDAAADALARQTRLPSVLPAYPQLGKGFMTAWSESYKVIQGWMLCSLSSKTPLSGKTFGRYYCAATGARLRGYRSESMDVVQFQMPLGPGTTLGKDDQTLIVTNPDRSLVDNVLLMRTTVDNSPAICEDTRGGPVFTAAMQWFFVLNSLLQKDTDVGTPQPDSPSKKPVAPNTSCVQCQFAPEPFKPPPEGILAGWMTKKPLSGNLTGLTKNRFFVLCHKSNMLRIYKDATRKTLKALLQLTKDTELQVKGECSFELKPKSGNRDKRKLIANTSTADMFDLWVRNIQAIITKLKGVRMSLPKSPKTSSFQKHDLENILTSIENQHNGGKMLTYLRAKELIIAKFGPVYYQSVRDKLNDCLMQRHLKRQDDKLTASARRRRRHVVTFSPPKHTHFATAGSKREEQKFSDNNIDSGTPAKTELSISSRSLQEKVFASDPETAIGAPWSTPPTTHRHDAESPPDPFADSPIALRMSMLASTAASQSEQSEDLYDDPPPDFRGSMFVSPSADDESMAMYPDDPPPAFRRLSMDPPPAFRRLSMDSPPAFRESMDPAPAFRQSMDPEPAFRQSMDPAPAFRQSMDPAPAFQQSMDPAPAFRESMDPAPAFRESMDPAPAFRQYMDPAPAFRQSMDPAPAFRLSMLSSSASHASTPSHMSDASPVRRRSLSLPQKSWGAFDPPGPPSSPDSDQVPPYENDPETPPADARTPASKRKNALSRSMPKRKNALSRSIQFTPARANSKDRRAQLMRASSEEHHKKAKGPVSDFGSNRTPQRSLDALSLEISSDMSPISSRLRSDSGAVAQNFFCTPLHSNAHSSAFKSKNGSDTGSSRGTHSMTNSAARRRRKQKFRTDMSWIKI